jgi:hypothetical protein
MDSNTTVSSSTKTPKITVTTNFIKYISMKSNTTNNNNPTGPIQKPHNISSTTNKNTSTSSNSSNHRVDREKQCFSSAGHLNNKHTNNSSILKK